MHLDFSCTVSICLATTKWYHKSTGIKVEQNFVELLLTIMWLKILYKTLQLVNHQWGFSIIHNVLCVTVTTTLLSRNLSYKSFILFALKQSNDTFSFSSMSTDQRIVTNWSLNLHLMGTIPNNYFKRY